MFKQMMSLLVVAGLVLAMAPAARAAPIVAPIDGYTGDYRLAFASSSHVMASPSRTMADYNADATAAAAAVTELAALSTTWTCIGSTPTVDARDNTGTNPSSTGIPIYTTSGLRIADDNADLWDASIQNPIMLDDGTSGGNLTGGQRAYSDYTWTGTNTDGTGASSGDGRQMSSGPGNIRVSRGGRIDAGWISGVSINDTDTRGARVYGLSDVITPGGVPPASGIAVVNTAGAAVPDTGSPPPHDLENNPYVMSFYAGAAADKLIVQLSGETSGGAIVVTYDGVPLTLAPDTASGRNQGIYYLDDPYTGGAADLIVDMTAKDTVNGIGLGVVSISGSAPGVAATANDSSNSVTITPTVDGSFVMAGFGAQGNPGNGSADAPLIQLYGGNIGSADGAAGYELDVPLGANIYSFSGGNTPFGSGAAAFAPATAAVPEPSTFVLAALGLLGLGVVARRRKRQQ